jgi:hypothetical protein
MPLGIGQQFVGPLFGLEQRFLLLRLGVALRVFDNAQRLLLGPADGLGGDSLAVGDPHGEHGRRRHRGDQDVDQKPEYRRHA